MTFNHKITDRQLVALVASYFGQPAQHTPSGIYGEAHEKAGQPYWRTHTNMGGAIGRMIDDLRGRGYFTEYNRHEDFGDKSSNALTVKGLDALIERLDRLPTIRDHVGETLYRFAIDRKEIDARRQARAEREADMISKREEARAADRKSANEAAERDRVRRLAKLRELFAAETLADNWPDDRLLAFADKIASV